MNKVINGDYKGKTVGQAAGKAHIYTGAIKTMLKLQVRRMKLKNSSICLMTGRSLKKNLM